MLLSKTKYLVKYTIKAKDGEILKLEGLAHKVLEMLKDSGHIITKEGSNRWGDFIMSSKDKEGIEYRTKVSYPLFAFLGSKIKIKSTYGLKCPNEIWLNVEASDICHWIAQWNMT